MSKEENTVKFRVVKIVFRIILAVLTVLLGTLAMLAYKGIFWMFKTWNHLTMDELVFHLNSPLEGTNEGMIKDFFNSCGIITIATAVILIIVMILLMVLCK